jgi:sensor histidine kinase YesM
MGWKEYRKMDKRVDMQPWWGSGKRWRLPPMLTVLGIGHLLSFYMALLQMPAGGPLPFYPDAALWLSLQILLCLWFSRQWFGWLAPRQVAIGWQLLSAVLVLSTLLLLPQLLVDAWLAYPVQPTLLLKQWLLYALMQLLVSLWWLYQRSARQAQQRQQQLQQAETARASLQLALLQQQFEPHFLFNNLNVLSALMHRNADEADEFLQQFTAVYRYVWQHKAELLVSLDAELAFATDYLALLNRRFTDSYQLLQTTAVSAESQCWQLVPGTLQLALENLVKHNRASPAQPLTLTIDLHA